MIEHSYTTSAYAGRTLASRSADGAKRLSTERRVDRTVEEWIAAHGEPNYFYVVDRERIYFFYTKEDEAVMFQRDMVPPSEAQSLGRIPGTLLARLPRSEVEAIQAQRATIQHQADARAAAARRQAARRPRATRAAPAARAPSAAGWSSRAFDVKAIVARMRPPLTAADPGVHGWRETRLPGGIRAGTASAGTTRYEVRSDRVSVSAPIPASGRAIPARARLGVVRVNNAIFGGQADGVNDAVLALAAKVSADPSGRTSFARRMAGRTIRVGRVLSQGRLVYSVYP